MFRRHDSLCDGMTVARGRRSSLTLSRRLYGASDVGLQLGRKLTRRLRTFTTSAILLSSTVLSSSSSLPSSALLSSSSSSSLPASLQLSLLSWLCSSALLSSSSWLSASLPLLASTLESCHVFGWNFGSGVFDFMTDGRACLPSLSFSASLQPSPM